MSLQVVQLILCNPLVQIHQFPPLMRIMSIKQSNTEFILSYRYYGNLLPFVHPGLQFLAILAFPGGNKKDYLYDRSVY